MPFRISGLKHRPAIEAAFRRAFPGRDVLSNGADMRAPTPVDMERAIAKFNEKNPPGSRLFGSIPDLWRILHNYGATGVALIGSTDVGVAVWNPRRNDDGRFTTSCVTSHIDIWVLCIGMSGVAVKTRDQERDPYKFDDGDVLLGWRRREEGRTPMWPSAPEKRLLDKALSVNTHTVPNGFIIRALREVLGSKVHIRTMDQVYATCKTSLFKELLAADQIDQRTYIAEKFDCNKFAMLVKVGFDEKTGLDAMGVVLDDTDSHATNVFAAMKDSSDKIDSPDDLDLFFFEPQSDKRYTPGDEGYSLERGLILI